MYVTLISFLRNYKKDNLYYMQINEIIENIERISLFLLKQQQ